ncbi:hypothetical protein M0L70_RS19160 [Providencia rettgeri]|nr:hypothetical protein [Providencia rettgeri]
MCTKVMSSRRNVIILNNGMDDTASHQDAQHQFEELLTIPIKGGVNNNDITQERKCLSYIDVSNSAELCEQLLKKLSLSCSNNQNNQLKWCLTNGPLAGMIIEADYNEVGISICLYLNTSLYNQELNKIIEQIKRGLSIKFNCSIFLKVNHADT